MNAARRQNIFKREDKPMAKPALLTVDDDREVLRAVERDLRRRYADRYRVLRADSGQAALDILRELKVRNDAVALFLVDQRMPGMSGVEFIKEANELFPDAKRVLLTAYADTDAAIKAINEANIQHYLLKPWDPPEENLYPVLDDLLEEWQANFRPPFEGIRVVGNRWSPKSHAAKDFLARNQVPYQWLDVEAAERDAEVRRVVESLTAEELRHLPIVVLPDGARLKEPTTAEIAARVGLRTRADAEFYDLAIIGGGPAGLAAAVYGASEGLRTVMVEREAPGGQAGMSSRIENYLGFPSGLSGADLARRAVVQAKRFGVEILSAEATRLRVEDQYRFLRLADDSEISCHALMIATGMQWRKLDVPGLEGLTGAGVYYGAAMTEVLSCKDQEVYVVGGANSAGQAAMHFAQYAKRVVMLVRGDSLEKSMSQYLIDQIKQTANIQVKLNSEIVEAHGGDHLEAVSVYCSQSGETNKVAANYLFIFIGASPRTDWLEGTVERDKHGFILTGGDLMRGDGKRPRGWALDRDPFLLETNVPGVFAVGDVRKGSIKRVASGVGEGSVAVSFIHQYLSKVV
jgi:thioredoxin reductase (NADPH)